MGKYYSSVNIGKVHISNDDAALAIKNKHGDILLVVADGIGGQKRGDLASKIAIDNFNSFSQKRGFLASFSVKNYLVNTALKINEEIIKEAENSPFCHKMATTLVAAIIRKKHIYILNIGDSRAYIKYDYLFKRVTIDQTLGNVLLKKGDLTEAEYLHDPSSHILINALGQKKRIKFQYLKYQYNNELVFLCSDGVSNFLSEDNIKMILASSRSVEYRVKKIFDTVNTLGGLDNMAIAIYDPEHD